MEQQPKIPSSQTASASPQTQQQPLSSQTTAQVQPTQGTPGTMQPKKPLFKRWGFWIIIFIILILIGVGIYFLL